MCCSHHCQPRTLNLLETSPLHPSGLCHCCVMAVTSIHPPTLPFPKTPSTQCFAPESRQQTHCCPVEVASRAFKKLHELHALLWSDSHHHLESTLGPTYCTFNQDCTLHFWGYFEKQSVTGAQERMHKEGTMNSRQVAIITAQILAQGCSPSFSLQHPKVQQACQWEGLLAALCNLQFQLWNSRHQHCNPQPQLASKATAVWKILAAEDLRQALWSHILFWDFIKTRPACNI